MAEPRFYLGRLFDPKKKILTSQAMNYDPADLTTHAVVTGMTGSGKTGLCIDILEEAALQGIPAIVIDPKGDLTNLLLHFPELAPQDFQPWIDPEIARRAGRSLEQASEEASAAWRTGLKEWGIDAGRIMALRNAAQFAIFTPGSNAGIPVSVLSSLAAPDLEWESHREVLRERISSTVTALLGLVGHSDIDPLQSREHILLSNLFENAWSQGQGLELTELILQTQNPPFQKLGAFPIDTFFPSRDRTLLATKLNNILAAPAFEAWREGEPLDIQALLFTADGRPRHSIFYLAHLADAERMFFVTLLLSAVETWMRTQGGSTSLRALLYMDEIFGYLPPTANPPSKQPMLRLLKMARAFGLGLLLATQNPVDMDYKALSNAGTWFIGKLQTEQDKNRLLDGLESVGGGFSRSAMDSAISGLGKRVFILKNVHQQAPVLFETRWTMNFLAGPLTRVQIPALNRLAGEGASEARTQAPPASKPMTQSRPAPEAGARRAPGSHSQTRPSVPTGIAEYFLPQNLSLQEAFAAAGITMPADAALAGVLYKPALLAAAQLRFLDRKFGVDASQTRAALVEELERSGMVPWEQFIFGGALDKIDAVPAAQARFDMIDPPLNDAKRMAALQKDFADWVYRNSSVTARANTALKVYGGPDVTQADFMNACAEAARAARDAELARKTAVLDRQIKSLQGKLGREARELQQDQTELGQRKTEELGNLAELGASLVGIGRKKSLTTQLTKRRLTEQAKGNVEESLQTIAQYEKDLAELQAQRAAVAAEINDRWGQLVNDITEVKVTPKKTDVFVKWFGVAWVPYYRVQAGGQGLQVRAFAPD